MMSRTSLLKNHRSILLEIKNKYQLFIWLSEKLLSPEFNRAKDGP